MVASGIVAACGMVASGIVAARGIVARGIVAYLSPPWLYHGTSLAEHEHQDSDWVYID